VTGSLFLVVRLMVVLLYVAILVRVVMSWVDARHVSSLGRVVYRTTEPILGPIRRALPPTGMIDLSPLVALLLLTVVAGAVGLR
jgi:YggT family protein